MVRRLLVAAVALSAAVSLSAQTPQGWKVRVDRSTSASDPDNTPNLVFKAMGKGLHVKGGPAGTFWNPANTATGNYTLKGTFNLQEPSNHTNYYGSCSAARTSTGRLQAVRVLRRRAERHVHGAAAAGRERHRRGGPSGQSRRAAAGRQRPVVERARSAGQRRHRVLRSSTAPWCIPGRRARSRTDGQVGVRVNHVLDVQFEGFEVGK
jgi:hypothetical protein